MGVNAALNPKFDNEVRMWVFEEMVNGSKLTEIINTSHENVKYLPGHKLPPNLVRSPFSCFFFLHVVSNAWFGLLFRDFPISFLIFV